MKTRLYAAIAASLLVSAGAHAQLTDDPNNNVSNVTGTSAPSGTVGAVLGSFAPPTAGTNIGLEHDGNGDLLNTEIGNDDFYTHTTTGAAVGGLNSMLPQNAGSIGIATDGTNVYVSDVVSFEVDIFTVAGAYVSSFDVSGFSTFPEGITYAPFDGNLYVVDGTEGNRAGMFGPDGTPGPTFPLNGSSIDGIAWDNIRCQFWVYDSGTDTVRAYDNEFNASTTFAGTAAAGFGGGEGLGVVGDSLFVMATGANTVVEFDISNAPAADNAGELCPREPDDEARFFTSKSYDDGNVGEVEVTLSCNTGLPLEQTTTVAPGDPTNFVIGDFVQGDLDCVITETVPTGYAATYTYGDDVTSTTGCSFEAASGFQYTCDILNEIQPVEIEVTKAWIDENPQFDAINAAEAEYSCSNVSNVCEGGGCTVSGNLNFLGNPDTESFVIFPKWDGSTTCSITEVDVFDGGIEIDDSDCQGLAVVPGSGNSCTIVNTRLYEGIPTLSQYGLAILALMMLGVGFVASRRFV